MSGEINVFGVRHLSPMAAWHLREFLDEHQPELVLIEGPSDATPYALELTMSAVEPPVALLAYTSTPPVRTIVYPLAIYSPEYQALLWAKEQGARAELIDLPSDIFLGLADQQSLLLEKKLRDEAETTAGVDTELEPAAVAQEPSAVEVDRATIYQQVATIAGESDYESYWERHFEHNLASDSFRQSALELGGMLRDLEEDAPAWRAENLVREAYMRRQIAAAIASGTPPEKIVAVVGAFHAPVLTSSFPPMTDRELASLPRREALLTLMPYSYFKLSSQSGYGAGNRAPAYFELLWNTLPRRKYPRRNTALSTLQQSLEKLAPDYLSSIARQLRSGGTHRSTAEVIDGVRLAKTLSALRDGLAPTLADLHDAAVALLGHGELASIKHAIAQVDVGTRIGSLPDGTSRTSIQSDFERELKRLKLERYRTTVAQDLTLDLRENRQVKSEEAAFLDLARSSFLHRLVMLGITFVNPHRDSRSSDVSPTERWVLRWSPEAEIALVEAVLLGETIELATQAKFKQLLEECSSINEAALLVRHACECGLFSAMEHARRRLQELAAESSEFCALATAAWQLAFVVQYGDMRQVDASVLLPLIEELFVQGAIALFDAASCDTTMARSVLLAIDEQHRVYLQLTDLVEGELWLSSLERLARSDTQNALLSGYATAILLERERMTSADLSREVSRRLSPGASAELGAGWFEGLAMRNRYALLARQTLWERLADYISALDDEEFKRALVSLRRVFGTFTPQNKRQIVENLSHYWQLSTDAVSELIEQPLTPMEEEKLESLNDFDFGDL